jgi:hypothetical protein
MMKLTLYIYVVQLFINLSNVEYPFVEKKRKYIGRKVLAPELHNQLKYTPPTFRQGSHRSTGAHLLVHLPEHCHHHSCSEHLLRVRRS